MTRKATGHGPLPLWSHRRRGSVILRWDQTVTQRQAETSMEIESRAATLTRQHVDAKASLGVLRN